MTPLTPPAVNRAGRRPFGFLNTRRHERPNTIASRSGWVGCIGPESGAAFSNLSGDCRIVAPCGALAAIGGLPGRSGPIRDSDGRIGAGIGDDTEAGCSAAIDHGGGRVTLACDPFGLHSVFTSRRDDTLWFASSLHLLRQFAGTSAEVRLDALHGYLCFSHVPAPATLFAGIEALPAGSRVTLEAGQDREPVETTEIDWCAQEVCFTDEGDALQALRVKVRAAVARQLGDRREVGVFLSGGLDSSLIAAMLVEAGARLRLYTLDFGPPNDSELTAARQAAAYLKQPLTVVPARVRDIARALEGTAAALELPFGDAVTVPLYLLGQAAAQEVDTVFNGEFGDQLFGGWANKPMIAAELYGAPDYSREQAYLATFHRFHGLTDGLYTDEMRQAMGDPDVGGWIGPALASRGSTGLLHLLRSANLRLKGAQNIGPRARQLAEACGLNVRSPFCDRDLADWTFACPPQWFLQGACEKYLLKRAAENYLPAEVVWQEKRGMGVPATAWCTGALRRTISRVLNSRRLKRDGWFRPEAVQALCGGADHPAEFRTRRLGEKLWALLMLHVWLDMHG